MYLSRCLAPLGNGLSLGRVDHLGDWVLRELYTTPLLVCGLLPYYCLMCRNIKTLFNFDPPATTEEVMASSLQFVRKLSGFSKPSKANEAAFALAVKRVSSAAQELLNSLVTTTEPKNRETEAVRAKERARVRFAK